ncbi:MAG: hypothetical protein Q9167_007781 [Letrouitia subvulpina]
MGLVSWLGKKLVADDACLEDYRRRHTTVISRPRNYGGTGPGGMGPMATGPTGGQDQPGGPRYADEEDAGGGRNPYASSERGSARSGSRARSEDEGAYDVGAMSDHGSNRGQRRSRRRRKGQQPRRREGNGYGHRMPHGSHHGDPEVFQRNGYHSNGFQANVYDGPYQDPQGYGGFDDYGGYGGHGMPDNHFTRHMRGGYNNRRYGPYGYH